MEFSISRHTAYFCGYLSATGKALSTDEIDVSMGAEIIRSRKDVEAELQGDVVAEKVIEYPIGHLENSLAELFQRDLESRLLQDLIVSWTMFKGFSKSYQCTQLIVEFDYQVLWQAVYVLEIDQKYTVLVVMTAESLEGNNA